MAKWVKVDRPWHGLSIHALVFNKIDFYAGKADSWGISIEYSHYERGICLKIFNLYAGFDVWRKVNDKEDND